MQSWHCVMEKLRSEIGLDSFWQSYLQNNANGFGIHLAILVEPFLQYILDGKKTIESRFSVNKIAPYGQVYKGDILLLKRSGGPIVALCQVADVWYYELDPRSWREIRQEFTQMLCAQDPSFWDARKSASFATLMRIKHIKKIAPIQFTKKDRRGWVVMKKKESHIKSQLSDTSTIIGFSGAIGSGKSTISTALKEKIGWHRVSFGDFVRNEARKNNLPECREVLQEIGERLVENSDEFCSLVLSAAHWNSGDNLIIDGIRHLRILLTLKKITKPSEVFLIYIETDDQTRNERIGKRNKGEARRIKDYERQSTEVEVNTLLRASADLIIDSSRPVADNLESIISMLNINTKSI